MDLPIELRKVIYELCLVKGTVYPMPRPKYDHRYDNMEPFEKPEWALLAVNQQIRIEASEILLKQNHFVISYEYDAMDNIWVAYADSVCEEEPLTLPSLARYNLKSVSITFDVRGIFVDAINVADAGSGCQSADMTDGERIHAAHEGVEDHYLIWEHMATTFDRAEFLQVDISNAYCPLGCHRYIEFAADAIGNAVQSNSKLQTLEILGTKTADERAGIKKVIAGNLAFRPRNQRSFRMLRFKSLDCASPLGPAYNKCLGLHSKDFEDGMENEEVNVKELVRSRKKGGITKRGQ
jgi:hypothetical protein